MFAARTIENEYLRNPFAVQDGADKNLTLRVNVDLWQDTMVVTYRRSSQNEQRVLENDVIKLYGKYQGIVQYQSVLGQTISAPLVAAHRE
jgi:hypothetical protein